MIGASFVVFGVADVVRIIMATPPVAKMGGLHVSFDEFYYAYQRYFSHLKQQEPKASDSVLAAAPNEVIKNMIASKIMQHEPTRLGIVVPSSLVTRYVKSVPYFQNGNGFDPELFARVLGQAGMSPQDFMRSMRDNLLHQQFSTPVASGCVLNSHYKELLVNIVRCRKHFEFFEVPSSVLSASEPSDSKLETWLSEHKEKYCVPEKRDVALLLLKHDVIASSIPVNEQDVDAEMKLRSQSSKTREIQALTFDSNATALEAQKAILEAKSLEGVKKKFLDVNVSTVDLTKLPANLAEMLAGLGEWETLGPLVAGKQHVLYVVTKVTEGERPAVNRNDVVLDLKKRQLPSKLAVIKDQIDDMLASAQSFNDVKAKFPVEVVTVSGVGEADAVSKFEETGLDEKLREAVIAQVFTLDKNSDSSFMDVSNYSVIVRVTDIVAAHQPALDDVRAQVQSDWTKDDQHKKATEWAYSTFGDVHDDHTLWTTTVAKLKGNVQKVTASRLDLFVGDDKLSSMFSNGTIERLMLTKKHSLAYVDTIDGRVVVAFVADTSLSASDALDTKKIEMLDRFRKTLVEREHADCGKLVQASVVGSYRVKVNDKVLRSVTARTEG
jgi:hypothetical protein